MKKTEDTIQHIRGNLTEMWTLVEGQVARASDALINNNKNAAHEVRNFEKKVDSYELMIDRECEHFFALLSPVAIDMRLMISILKINNDLERIGDFAYGISKTVLNNYRDSIPDALLEKLRLAEMFEQVLSMINLCKTAFNDEDSKKIGAVFTSDNLVDSINWDSTDILTEYMKKHPEHIYYCLQLNSTIRRIERIGDRCVNIAEDIIFYLEAKVLKHQGKTTTMPSEEKEAEEAID